MELGEHCHTHIIPRLKKVIDGEDKGGITEAVGWKGGGGFRYYRLAPSLLEKDKWEIGSSTNNITPPCWPKRSASWKASSRAAATSIYWQHGAFDRTGLHLRDHATPGDRRATGKTLATRSEQTGALGAMFLPSVAGPISWPNLTVKKIPKAVLTRCEWGHDDYSLNVENLPKAPPKPAHPPEEEAPPPLVPNPSDLFGASPATRKRGRK